MVWRFAVSLALTVAFGVLGEIGWSSFPPLGRFLTPFRGVWRNGPQAQVRAEWTTEIEGLTAAVDVVWDEHGIPHVFAQNQADLHFAQGYIVAFDRLWQMDLHTRVAAGRLSELAGRATVERDRFFVGLGLRESAAKSLDEMRKDPETAAAIAAYTAGVNAFIDGLNEITLPAEYKLLGARPERWSDLRTAFLLKIMSFGLSGRSHDLDLTRVRRTLGPEAEFDLFPDWPANVAPVIFDPKDLPKAPKPRVPEGQESFLSELDLPAGLFQPERGNGSNNWAVSGRKTRSGFPIVANDTHLSYSLPNIWYEMQLTAPDVDVYGATFPAAPGIIIGFNRDMAWAVTNATMDVMDFFEVKFSDSNLEHYLHAEDWWPTRRSREWIKVKGGRDVAVDLVWTHHGVLVNREGLKGLVMRWIAHEPSNDLKAFSQLNRARSYAECTAAIRHYSAPAQNFICADRRDIGLWHNGRYPRKWPGQGRHVLDGSKASSEWPEWIDRDELPHVTNPAAGYVRSANQHPVRDTYPYYMGWFYDDSYRAARVDELLRDAKDLTWQDMERFQNDVYDLYAREALPPLLNALTRQDLTTDQAQLVRELEKWNFENTADSRSAAFAARWLEEVRRRIWEDQMPKSPTGGTFYPQNSRLAELLRAPEALRNKSWVDDIRTTPKLETLSDIAGTSFRQTWTEMKEEFGSSAEWSLARAKPTRLRHLARIPGFGREDLLVGGGTYTLNANRGDHGAVWRMVVELGPEVKGYVNFPGGPSGVPFDRRYESFVEDWSKGRLRETRFLKSAQKPENGGLWRLNPKGS